MLTCKIVLCFNKLFRAISWIDEQEFSPSHNILHYIEKKALMNVRANNDKQNNIYINRMPLLAYCRQLLSLWNLIISYTLHARNK